MFGGKKRRLTIRFISPLLDTTIDRFGTKGVSYSKLDETHFTVTADVEISEQFFSWMCGFGNKAKILSPDFVVDEFREYLDKIRGMYWKCTFKVNKSCYKVVKKLQETY